MSTMVSIDATNTKMRGNTMRLFVRIDAFLDNATCEDEMDQ